MEKNKDNSSSRPTQLESWFWPEEETGQDSQQEGEQGQDGADGEPQRDYWKQDRDADTDGRFGVSDGSGEVKVSSNP